MVFSLVKKEFLEGGGTSPTFEVHPWPAWKSYIRIFTRPGIGGSSFSVTAASIAPCDQDRTPPNADTQTKEDVRRAPFGQGS
jgi:hypothetical protein